MLKNLFRKKIDGSVYKISTIPPPLIYECQTIEVNPVKKTYFLVDFENVSYHGLKGLEDLGPADVVHIFYTSVCNNLQFSAVQQMLNTKAKLILEEVSNGQKNALDFQLSSYLGHLIAKNEDGGTEFVIVSKDNGYLPVIKFWKKTARVSLYPDLTKSRYCLPEGISDNPEWKNDLKKCCSNKEEFDRVLTLVGNCNNKMDFHNALQLEFPTKRVVAIYNCMKKHLQY